MLGAEEEISGSRSGFVPGRADVKWVLFASSSATEKRKSRKNKTKRFLASWKGEKKRPEQRRFAGSISEESEVKVDRLVLAFALFGVFFLFCLPACIACSSPFWHLLALFFA